MTKNLTDDERAVMRELVRWRRANGVGYDHFTARWHQPSTARAVTYDSSPWNMTEVGTCEDYWRKQIVWHRVDSFTQAVDLLVALGYLPARFSSAYRAGWEAGREDMEHPVAAGAEFRAIVPAGGAR